VIWATARCGLPSAERTNYRHCIPLFPLPLD
jgi:hypothetical protein